ncbi:Mitochondrial intermembrane space import and assembly protein 40 [Cladobotryum mycophilum]|uniref:Mitochondrial intermembrane space import and assembly protein 40 n=1 Tax=Cladobotryum mycophilum TaxID=491253 RepID=A0ABR0SXQ6_9HYPO
MYRTALRSATRPAINGLRNAAVRTAPRRFASTASPVDKSRSWKSSAARWGLAVAGVYYYNTSSTFADELSSQTLASHIPYADSDMPTVDSLVEQRRKETVTKPAEPTEKKPAETDKKPETQVQSATALEGSPAALEEEAVSLLGGMAHGPCGEEFKTAFSCFVYSEEEPKGMDCIEKFQGMQECFRQYPEIYGSELEDTESDEPTETAGLAEPAQSVQPAPVEASAETPAPENVIEKVTDSAASEFQQLREEHPTQLEPKKPTTDSIPAAKKVETATPWTDTTAANEEAKKDEKKEQQ